jgi:hypothetical protein
MEEDFAAGRVNPLENVSGEQLNELLSSVAAAFDLEWLKQGPGNRIRTLWSRQDALATNQLAILGDSLKRMLPFDRKWIANRIEAIKSEGDTEHKGDLFEILGLSLFAVGDQVVLPTKEDHPGYDGIITFRGGGKGLVSLKDFGTSAHHKGFQLQAAKIEHAFADELQRRRMTGVNLRLGAKRHPGQEEWERLRRCLPDILECCRTRQRPFPAPNNWHVEVSGMPAPNTLDTDFCSYTLVAHAPHHPNEQKNIESKIEKACGNLSKHSRHISTDFLRILLIRLPETAAPQQCIDCANEWLRARPDASVDSVVFYQPAVALDMARGTTSITHFVGMGGGMGLARWLEAFGAHALPIRIEVKVGVCTSKPTLLQLTNGVRMDGQYVFQSGQIYSRCQNAPDGSIVGQMSNPVPGIRVHSVMRIPGQSGNIVVEGKFPPDGNLLLYS